jgi:hypothetical protein
MAIALIFRCPRCRARIKAPVQLIGQARLCPGCAELFVVPPQAPGDVGPVMLPDGAGPGRTVQRPALVPAPGRGARSGV